MKTYLLLMVVVGLANGKPGTLPEDAERVPSVASRDPEFFYGGATPFDFLRSFNDIFEQMRRQMAVLLTQGRAGVGGAGAGDLGDGNSTSVTRVIGGHRYTVNETVYSGGDGETAIFKVRVVDIRPQDSSEEDPKTTNLKDKEVDSLENDVNRPFQKREIELEDEEDNLNLDNDIEYTDREPLRVMPGHYIGDDLRVNDLLFARGQPMNPDAELVDFDELEQTQEEKRLGDDLRVNDIARRMGWGVNPDAEMIEDHSPKPEGYSMDSKEETMEFSSEPMMVSQVLGDAKMQPRLDFSPDMINGGDTEAMGYSSKPNQGYSMGSDKIEGEKMNFHESSGNLEVHREQLGRRNSEFDDVEIDENTMSRSDSQLNRFELPQNSKELEPSSTNLNPNVDLPHHVPVGHYMGNDIHVNHIAASRAWPLNPDAELIDFDEPSKQWNNHVDFGYNHVESESSRSRYYYNTAAADR